MPYSATRVHHTVRRGQPMCFEEATVANFLDMLIGQAVVVHPQGPMAFPDFANTGARCWGSYFEYKPLDFIDLPHCRENVRRNAERVIDETGEPVTCLWGQPWRSTARATLYTAHGIMDDLALMEDETAPWTFGWVNAEASGGLIGLGERVMLGRVGTWSLRAMGEIACETQERYSESRNVVGMLRQARARAWKLEWSQPRGPVPIQQLLLPWLQRVPVPTRSAA